MLISDLAACFRSCIKILLVQLSFGSVAAHTDQTCNNVQHAHTHTLTLKLQMESANLSSTTDESRVQPTSLE